MKKDNEEDKSNYTPNLKTKQDAINDAKERINQERSGKQLGLRTGFPQLNICVGKYFRFKTVNLIAGLSGHGKSALLNIILSDFLNEKLNGKFEEDVIIIHNSFEMLTADEVLRTASAKVEKSHLALLSSEWVNPTEEQRESGIKGHYNRISDEDFDLISKALESDISSNHYYYEEPTTISGIAKNIAHAIKYYQDNNPSKPIPKAVIAIDHTLLVEPEKNEQDLKTISNLAKFCVKLKKKGYMAFLIGQLNNNIELPERLKNSDLHYPMKSDIYAQGQIFNACDTVSIIHQPELLGISLYGKQRYDSRNLVHIHVIKQRFGKVGSIWLENHFYKGQLLKTVPQSNLPKSK